MDRALIISHSADFDGHASAAISRKFLELSGFSVSYLGVDHADGLTPGVEELLSLAAEADLVVLTDFSLDPEFCNQMFSQGKLIWIDHHISAIEGSQAHPYKDAPGIRRDGTAAQLLAWEYWTGRLGLMDEAPMAITLLGKYDVFDKDENWDLMVLPFQYWAQSVEHALNPINPGAQEYWERLFTLTPQALEAACNSGNQILSFQRNSLIKRVGDSHYARIEGYDYRFIAANTNGNGAMVFDGANIEGCDAMLTYYFNGKEWKITMYGWSNSPDLSIIAKAFGGGGHRHACGFRLPVIHPTVQLSPMPRKEQPVEQNPESETWPFFKTAEELPPVEAPVEEPNPLEMQTNEIDTGGDLQAPEISISES